MEEVRRGRKELAFKNMRKIKGNIPSDLMKILISSKDLNAQSGSAILPTKNNLSHVYKKINPDSAKTSKNSDIKLSARGDRVQNIEEVNRKFNDDLDRQQKKATDELFLFRDLPRGSRLDNTSVTAVRQLLENNVAAFPEKIKKGFVKFFESLVSFKPPKGMGTITAENFVTSATTAGLLRKYGESAYLTIGDNTLRVSHHNTSVETFEKHGEADNNILSIVFEKRDAKPFKGKDSVNAVEYVYKKVPCSENSPIHGGCIVRQGWW